MAYKSPDLVFQNDVAVIRLELVAKAQHPFPHIPPAFDFVSERISQICPLWLPCGLHL